MTANRGVLTAVDSGMEVRGLDFWMRKAEKKFLLTCRDGGLWHVLKTVKRVGVRGGASCGCALPTTAHDRLLFPAGGRHGYEHDAG